jgi:hypothetical protein
VRKTLADRSQHSVVQNIPQVYTGAGWGQVYLLIGVSGSIVALLLALWLKSGRTPGTSPASRLGLMPGRCSSSRAAPGAEGQLTATSKLGWASSNARRGAGMAQVGVSRRVMLFVATIPRW